MCACKHVRISEQGLVNIREFLTSFKADSQKKKICVTSWGIVIVLLTELSLILILIVS